MIRRFARPYAKAMMELGGSPQQARALHEELARFEKARAGSPELVELFGNPAVDSDGKVAVAREIATRVGVSALGLRLVEVLVRHHRVNDLDAVLEAWGEMIHEALGISVAEVRTAHALDRGEEASLRSALEAKLGRTVELRLTTDASLLGGFVAQVESEVWDASVRGKLNRFREALT
ncbi:MAG TPA: ATP synthase F1 subunit delta [Thermoanaerobaculia bacterium]|nr:ATP synthase F1 subunit delta [Thermoanaerobaculia bacterium]